MTGTWSDDGKTYSFTIEADPIGPREPFAQAIMRHEREDLGQLARDFARHIDRIYLNT